MMSANPRSRAERIITGVARITTRQLVPGPKIIRPPAPRAPTVSDVRHDGPPVPVAPMSLDGTLDRASDRAENRADLVAQEDQSDNRNDRDEGEDQRVLGETLAFLFPTNRGEELANDSHRLPPDKSGPADPGRLTQ